MEKIVQGSDGPDKIIEATLKKLMEADKMLAMLKNEDYNYKLDDIVMALRWFFQSARCSKITFADRAVERTDVLYRGKKYSI